MLLNAKYMSFVALAFLQLLSLQGHQVLCRNNRKNVLMRCVFFAFYFLSITDIALITSGYAGSQDVAENQGKQVEVLDLLDENVECTSPASLSKLLIGATGGLVSNSPLICGGTDLDTNTVSQVCLQPGNASVQVEMLEPRANAGSTTTLNKGLWITGGNAANGDMLSTTEFISLIDGELTSQVGPSLLYPMRKHCMTPISDDLIMFIGGHREGQSETKSVLTYDLQADLWEEKADFINKRIDFGCATFTLKNDQIMVAIVGGRPNSVEFYDIEQNEWKAGPDFPVKATGLTVLPNLNGNGLFAIGGDVESETTGTDKMTGSIYELDCSNDECQWMKQERSLQVPRSYHVSLLVPDNFTQCNSACRPYYYTSFLLLTILLFASHCSA